MTCLCRRPLWRLWIRRLRRPLELFNRIGYESRMTCFLLRPGHRASRSTTAVGGRGAPQRPPEAVSRGCRVIRAGRMNPAAVPGAAPAPKVRAEQIASWIRRPVKGASVRVAPVWMAKVCCGFRAKTYMSTGTHAPRHKGRSCQDSGNLYYLPSRAP